jgi:putative spermidine/putrescine transport system ATP-binding protein
VGRSYGDFQALHPTDLEVADGECLVILGPSGSGKSTMLKLVAGFDKPTCGTIQLAGRDITHMDACMRNIGMVFQNYALFPHLTVFGNVAFPLSVRGLQRDAIRSKVGEALALVGLEGFEERKIHSLSGGQAQRVALARGLVFDPSLLLLDEPLSALDKQLREQMQTELRRIHRDVGATFVGVTHDQREALIMADRIVVMRGGRIEQVGTPVDVYYRPESRFVAEFVGEVTIIDGQTKSVEQWQEAQLVRVQIDGLPDLYGYDFASRQTTGRPAGVMVRPERVGITDQSDSSPEEGRNSVTGNIDTVEFSGEFVEVQVRTENGVLIKAKELASAGTFNEAWHEGHPVRVSWDYSDTVILTV